MSKSYEIAESVTGTFYYHLSEPDKFRSACEDQAQVMHTRIPLSTWGHKGHLRERWCEKCAKLLRGENDD